MKPSFRPYVAPADLVDILRIRKDSAVFDKADKLSTCEKFPSLDRLKEILDQSDSADRLLFMTLSGKVVGYSQITWWDLADGIRLYLHNEWVTPEHRSSDLMTQFLVEIEKRIVALSNRHGKTVTAAFGSNASESEQYRTELLTALGYTEVWAQVDMELADPTHLPAPAWPEGVIVAPLKPADYPKIWKVFNEAYEGGFGIPAPTDEGYREFVDDIEHREMCFVAWDGETVAGFILCTIAHDMGFVDELVTARSYQRRGVARALLLHAIATLPSRGLHAVRLLTAANNHSGARSLYESIGFRTVKLYKRYRKAMPA